MTRLETDIEIVLQQLQSKLSSQTCESRRRYFKQMLKLAGMLNIAEPCPAVNGNQKYRIFGNRTGGADVFLDCLWCQPQAQSILNRALAT